MNLEVTVLEAGEGSQEPRSHSSPDDEALGEVYEREFLHDAPDTFVLFRIIGNDLYPRHERGQTRANLRFILENEPELPGCEKRWVVNRVVDPDEHEAIIALLREHGQEYVDVPFVLDDFAGLDWDLETFPSAGYLSSPELHRLRQSLQDRAYVAAYRHKNNYLMHNNGARNIALEAGRRIAKWVLPWDGNCFVKAEAWREIVLAVTSRPHLKYFVVPMARVTDNALLLHEGFAPTPVEEPQIVFRCDAQEKFDEAYPYGRRPKVELFWRLGIPGKWDQWKDDPWDLKRGSRSSEAGQFGEAGWVARLSSGMHELERDDFDSFINRGLMRQQAIMSSINHVTVTHLGKPDAWALSSFNATTLRRLREEFLQQSDRGCSQEIIRQVLRVAGDALERSPGSVVDKSECAPSGDKRDYFHPAPYWWPDHAKPDGVPYIKKDGERVPGTLMYDPESDRYDRTRLQRLFDDGITLALAGLLTDDPRYHEHAAAWLRRWFVDPETRMNPHLLYSQVRRGHNRNEGFCFGIIEMKDIYYYLDAVRILERHDALAADDLSAFRAWLAEYLDWLLTSRNGRAELRSTNNHGVYYDLQVASIAAFLDDRETLFNTFIRARDRLAVHFSKNGVPCKEMTRTQTAHYCCFNLQGWLNLADLASRFGEDLATRPGRDGISMQAAVDWLSAHFGWPWPYKQIEPFDEERFAPIAFQARRLGLAVDVPEVVERRFLDVAGKRPLFHPHDGVRPYWNIEVLLSSPAPTSRGPFASA